MTLKEVFDIIPKNVEFTMKVEQMTDSSDDFDVAVEAVENGRWLILKGEDKKRFAVSNKIKY